MTYLEALYGSQYAEILQNKRDPAKGRLNGNLLFAAVLVLFLFTLFLIAMHFANAYNGLNGLENKFNAARISGQLGGKFFGLILCAAFYFIIANTVGTKKRYEQYAAVFMQYPEEVRKKANRKILTPFFILLGVFIACLLISL